MPQNLSYNSRGTEHLINGTTADNMSNPYSEALSGYGDYDQLFAANPYRKQTYQMSGFEKLWNRLGFKTGYDDWLDQTSTQIAEYDSGIFNMMYQNQYNEDSAKAARMREAGLNPDLLGTGDSANSATPADDPNGMIPAQSDEISKISSIFSGFATGMLNALGTGVQIYKSMADVKKIQADINSLAIGNASSIVDVVDKIIVGSVPLSVMEAGDNNSEALDQYLGNIDMASYGFTGSGLRAAERALSDRTASLKNSAELRKMVYDRYNAISDTYEVASKGFIPESQMPSSPDEMFNIQTACMARAAKRILELKQSNEEFQEGVIVPSEQSNVQVQQNITGDELAALDDSDYGSALASNKVTGVESDTFIKQAQRIINEERANMYSVLKVKADSGDSLAAAVLHAMVLQDLMQIDFGADVDYSTLKTFSAAAGGLFDIGSFGMRGQLDVKGKFEKALGKQLKLHVGVKSK